MKIVFFGNRVNLLSGHSRPVYYLAKELVSRGHKVIIVTNVFGTPLEKKRHKQVVKTEELGEIEIIGAFNKISDFILKKNVVKKTLAKAIKDAEIIHFQDFTSLTLFSLLFKEITCPTVCSLSGIPKMRISDFRKAGPTSIIRFLHNPLFIRNFLTPKFLSKREFARPEKIVISSRYLLEILEREYGVARERMKIIYPAIKTERDEEKKKKIEKKTKTFLYYGWGSGIRGLPDVPVAFEQAWKKRKNIKLIIATAARDPERYLLVKWIERKYSYLPITIKKFVPDIRALVDSVDFLIFPFRAEYGYAQPPIVILESMARGKPIISTSLGAVPEIIKNNQNGLLAEPANPEELSEKMVLLVDKPLLAKKLGENAFDYVVKNHGPEVIASQMLSLYAELIKNINKKDIFDQYWAKKEYSREGYVEEYDGKRFVSFGGQLFDRMEKEILAMAAPRNKKAKILEVGAGTGRMATFLAKNGHQVLVTDISKEMLREARKKAKEEKVLERVKFQIADIYELPYQRDSFDFVYCIRVVNQLFNNFDKEKAIKELIRVTKSGGVLLFDFINQNSLAFFLRPKGLITPGQVKKIVHRNGAEMIKIKGRMIFSQTILEKMPPIIAQFISKLDNAICQLMPFFATRVYFIVSKK